jgi:hypothetical protein
MIGCKFFEVKVNSVLEICSVVRTKIESEYQSKAEQVFSEATLTRVGKIYPNIM